MNSKVQRRKRVGRGMKESGAARRRGTQRWRLESRAVERVPLDGALSDRFTVECGTLKVRSEPGSSSKTSCALLSTRLY